MEDADGPLRIGEFCSSDVQVAINEGNRRRHAFFVVKMGKTGVATPYQQVIPVDFSKYHPKLPLEDVITLESQSCGREWEVTIRESSNTSHRFARGWRQFAVENHLRMGHQLLFHLVGKARFLVHFFDHRGKRHDSFLPVAAPLESTAPVELTPAFETVDAFPSTKLQTRTSEMSSDDAKVILRQFFRQVDTHMSTDGGSSIESAQDFDV